VSDTGGATSGQPETEGLDPRYVAARRCLLDALTALAPHNRAIVVAGAQAVYLRSGSAPPPRAPYTTDGDLALDPTLLGDDPELEATMRRAGFELLEPAPDRVEPGTWVATAVVDGQQLIIPIDLIVPEGMASGGGRRGARLGPHGNRAARRAVGLEAALVDHSPITIGALDPADSRTVTVEVASAAALLVAKMHKIHDRLASGRPERLDDKDAADVVRIVQTTSPTEVGATLAQLRVHPVAGPPTHQALSYLADLFGRRAGQGVVMASRALRLAMLEEQVVALCTAYTESLLATVRS